MRFESDAIDEACEENLGHTNWKYADTQDLEKVIAQRKGDTPKDEEIDHIVIFYKNPCEEEDTDE